MKGKGIRVPQSGWLHHAKPGHAEHDAGLGHAAQHCAADPSLATCRCAMTMTRSFAREDHVHAALFSTHPDDVRLYGKPMARNAQIWSSTFDAVLHGPDAGTPEIESAIRRMEAGGSFGYRFFYPPMQVGQSTVFWHRPLIACWDAANRLRR